MTDRCRSSPGRVAAWRSTLYAAIAFSVLLAEGAVFDWSGIYLATEQRAGAGLAPLGLAAFSLTMGLGRLLADPAANRYGEVLVARAGGLIAAAGLGLALVTTSVAPALAGFGVMGLGLAALFPLTLRAAARNADTAAPDRPANHAACSPPVLYGSHLKREVSCT